MRQEGGSWNGIERKLRGVRKKAADRRKNVWWSIRRAKRQEKIIKNY